MSTICLDGKCVPLLTAIVISLVGLVFGIGYNALVGWLEKSGHDRGYTAFLVVGGVTVTLLLAIPLVGLGVVLWLFVVFAATGLSMVIGSWARSSRARKQDEEGARQIAKELLHDQADGGRVCDEAGADPGKDGE